MRLLMAACPGLYLDLVMVVVAADIETDRRRNHLAPELSRNLTNTHSQSVASRRGDEDGNATSMRGMRGARYESRVPLMSEPPIGVRGTTRHTVAAVVMNRCRFFFESSRAASSATSIFGASSVSPTMLAVCVECACGGGAGEG